MKNVEASFEALISVVRQSSCAYFVWPEEDISELGEGFELDEDEVEYGYGDKLMPLLVDIQTAKLIVDIHELVDGKNKAKIERMIAKSRSSFVRVVEFAWSKVNAAA